MPDRRELDSPPPGEPIDAEMAAVWRWVSAAQEGDSEAFGALYNRYVDAVYRYLLFRLGDPSLAEDLTSETFLRALRRIGSVHYCGRDVGAWFITIARNLLFDHVKSGRYRLEYCTAEPAEPTVAPVTPEAQVIIDSTNAELRRCIRELGSDQQECILLRFMGGLSVSETAAAMQRNEGAIKALQHRAVRRLAQLMQPDMR